MTAWHLYFCMDVKHGLLQVKFIHLHYFYVTDNYGQKIAVHISVHVHGTIRPLFFCDVASTPCFVWNLLLSDLRKFKPGHTKWFFCVTNFVNMPAHSVAQILMSDFLHWGYMKEKLYRETWFTNWTQNHDHASVSHLPVFALCLVQADCKT
jgi:hypothetical protein